MMNMQVVELTEGNDIARRGKLTTNRQDLHSLQLALT